jgi:hypothetical protein
MKKDNKVNAIPKDVAWQLCTEIRQEHRGKWYTATWWQCWGCTTFSKGDPAKMCFSNADGYHGCNLVNARFDRQGTL